jgi:acyl-ACP thioesterase
VNFRRFTSEATVRLGDVGRDGRLRLAALARHLQDVATDDVRDSGIGRAGNWVVRRVVLDVTRLPRFTEAIQLETSCTGVGPRWAERATHVRGRDGEGVTSHALWVFVDDDGKPRPLPAEFRELYPVPDDRMRISPKLFHPVPPPASVSRHPWPLRVADFDVLGHMNNAAYWEPVDEELAAQPGTHLQRAELEYRSAIEPGEVVTVAVERHAADGALGVWLESGGTVRASARVWSASAQSEDRR